MLHSPPALQGARQAFNSAKDLKAPHRATGTAPIGPTKELHMAMFVVLAHFTDQGVRGIQDTPKRANAFKAMAKKAGANVKELYWTLGRYDIVAMVEAPDVETITAVGLSASKLGNVRTETLRAFGATEMAAILKKVG
jgi:uncharacterized protein with GYD domain